MTPLTVGAPLLVGMDAWLWVDNAGQHGYGPITRTATAGPVSVTATARVTKVVWDLGDGSRLTCRNAGTPWSPDKGSGPSPTCGHRYLTPSTAEPDGSFTVRATAHWQVEWTGAGQAGEITFTMDGERQQPVTEVQVLQTN
jgi:YD repeat-containing protein